LKAAKHDVWIGGLCLLAYRCGEVTDDAMVGAMLEADSQHCLRIVRDFLTKE